MKRAWMLVVAFGCARARQSTARAPALDFARGEQVVAHLSAAELAEKAPRQTVTIFDPYYRQEKRFEGFFTAALLPRVFGTGPESDSAKGESLRQAHFVLTARDGYVVTMSGKELLDEGAFLAVSEAGGRPFAPIGEESPAPFYLTWTGAGQQRDLDHYPRPYQLQRIALVPFAALFSHTVPEGAPSGGPAMRGFAIFRAQCLTCHAINQQGGRVGPDLNLPQSIVEYRPEAQIRTYIKDPTRFRYSKMPPHPNLTERDLDDLLAYFHAMKDRKNDPGAPHANP